MASLALLVCIAWRPARAADAPGAPSLRLGKAQVSFVPGGEALPSVELPPELQPIDADVAPAGALGRRGL